MVVYVFHKKQDMNKGNHKRECVNKTNSHHVFRGEIVRARGGRKAAAQHRTVAVLHKEQTTQEGAKDTRKRKKKTKRESVAHKLPTQHFTTPWMDEVLFCFLIE